MIKSAHLYKKKQKKQWKPLLFIIWSRKFLVFFLDIFSLQALMSFPPNFFYTFWRLSECARGDSCVLFELCAREILFTGELCVAAQRCNLGERFFAGRIRVLGDFHVAWKLKQREREICFQVRIWVWVMLVISRSLLAYLLKFIL